MIPIIKSTTATLIFLTATSVTVAQQPPYNTTPEINPPYYRVRYDASAVAGELDLPVSYTVWIPPKVETLRGVVVHQHGCGEGSCKSGFTGAFDLHWQALAIKHNCALFAAVYEQPQEADCQRWCDPRNGSGVRFQQSLVDLGRASGHSELESVPWALWGHSGGGVWCGIMTLEHPDRVAASWLRSGVPLVTPRPDRPSAKIVTIPEEPLSVPIMLNLGTKEGVTVTNNRFSGVWPGVKRFFTPLREAGSPIAVSIDPLTGHECGNQRYLAIPWFDECLSARLPSKHGAPLREMPTDQVWFASLDGTRAVPGPQFTGRASEAIWLPSEAIAKAWMQYVNDTQVGDKTPPPIPTNLEVKNGVLRWDAVADLESGIRQFVISQDGKRIGTVPETPRNPFGRPLFQGLQYSDTPLQPLVKMEYKLPSSSAGVYRVTTVNTVGLSSGESETVTSK